MWYTPVVSERIARDIVQDRLREVKHRQLTREAQTARGARTGQAQFKRKLEILVQRVTLITRHRFSEFFVP